MRNERALSEGSYIPFRYSLESIISSLRLTWGELPLVVACKLLHLEASFVNAEEGKLARGCRWIRNSVARLRKWAWVCVPRAQLPPSMSGIGLGIHFKIISRHTTRERMPKEDFAQETRDALNLDTAVKRVKAQLTIPVVVSWASRFKNGRLGER